MTLRVFFCYHTIYAKVFDNRRNDALKKLLSLEGNVFLGAIVGNQKQYYPLFDKIFALTLSAETLSKRLDTHSHTRTAKEKSRALAAHQEKQQRFNEQGLILVSSEGLVAEIVDEILANL